jgi:hypothetical protein
MTPGTREFYWAKDLHISACDDHPQDDDAIILIDVDYYVDMRAFLLQHPRNIVLLYTFTPTDAAKNDGQYSYRFDENNNVVTTVAGGGTYSHQLWDYSFDAFTVSNATCTIAYHIERRPVVDDQNRVVPDRTMLAFIPDAYWTFPMNLVVRSLVDTPVLQRFKPVKDGFVAFDVQTKEGLATTISQLGTYTCTSVWRNQLDAVKATKDTSSLKLAVTTTMRHVEEHVDAAIVTAYLQSQQVLIHPICIPPSNHIREYQYWTHSYDDDATPSLHSFMDPVVPECFAPKNSKANDEVTIAKRIKEVSCSTEADGFTLQAMEEFIALLVPEAHQAVPFDADVVWERQNRPSQQRILEQASQAPFYHKVISSFMKKEAYSEPKDPRNISTIPGVDKLKYSCYTYAAAEVFKLMPWYAFGQMPRVIANRVATICSNASFIDQSDFSRMDGRVSPAARTLERLFMLRLFKKEYHADLRELLQSQFGLVGYTTHHVKYEQGTSRASGSPETSIFNTLLNAFVAYLAFRRTKNPYGYLTPTEAWARLGIYGGDDGLTANLDPKCHTAAAKKMGQVLTVDVKKRGEVYVSFLARIYSPFVWTGSPSSCVIYLDRQVNSTAAPI